jgi:hypothetical protein
LLSREDLHADLLADLAPKVDEVPPPAPVEPEPLPPELHDVTPTLSLNLSPLRWSRPRVVRSSDGVGKAFRVGPLKVELAVKDD